MAVTKIRSKWVSGLLEFFGVNAGTTVLKITESGIEANLTGNVTGNVSGAVFGAQSIEKVDNYALSAAEAKALFINLKNTGSSKAFTLGLAAGQIVFVNNYGTETFKVKAIAGDTGSDLVTNKTALVIGSATANASTVIALN